MQIKMTTNEEDGGTSLIEHARLGLLRIHSLSNPKEVVEKDPTPTPGKSYATRFHELHLRQISKGYFLL